MVQEHKHGVGCNFRRPVEVAARPDGEIFLETLDGWLGKVSLHSHLVEVEPLGHQPEQGSSRYVHFPDDEGWIEARISGLNLIEISYRNVTTVVEFDHPVVSFTFWQPTKIFSVLCGESLQYISSFRFRTWGKSLLVDMIEEREFQGLGLTAIAADSDASFVGISSERDEFWSLHTSISDSNVLIPHGRAEDGGTRSPTGLASNGRGAWAFVDRDNYRVILKGNSGEICFVGEKGVGDHEFDWPNDLCFLGPTTILVADTNNDRVVSLDVDTAEFASVFSRNPCPDSLCRPVSLDYSTRGLTLVDRGNDRILELDPSGVTHYWGVVLQPGEKINASLTLSFDNQNRRYLLGRTHKAGFLREVSLDSMETVNEFDGELFDPQGMTKFGDRQIVLSDTLNRRGIFFDHQLAVLQEIDLAEISGMPRFLCRTPSVVRDTALFIDYSTGLTVLSSIAGDVRGAVQFDLNKIGFSSLRMIFEWGDKFVLFGRGNGGLAFLDEHFRLIVLPDRVTKLINDLRAPVDGVAFSSEKMIVIDKERDSILALSTDLFDGSTIAERVVDGRLDGK